MGQYHLILNTDKKEYLHPHSFGDGLKLLEFGCSGCGTMLALAVLLAVDNGMGGGDLYLDDGELEDIVGSWGGDSIIISGDYGEEEDYINQNGETVKENLHSIARSDYVNISCKILKVLCQDEDVKKALMKKMDSKLLGTDKRSDDIREAMGFKSPQEAAKAIVEEIKQKIHFTDSQREKEYYERLRDNILFRFKTA